MNSFFHQDTHVVANVCVCVYVLYHMCTLCALCCEHMVCFGHCVCAYSLLMLYIHIHSPPIAMEHIEKCVYVHKCMDIVGTQCVYVHKCMDIVGTQCVYVHKCMDIVGTQCVYVHKCMDIVGTQCVYAMGYSHDSCAT